MDSWIQTLSEPDRPTFRLICFPYAGGSASLYRPWVDLMPADWQLLAVQLPGRADRLKEKPADHMEDVAEPILESLEEYADLPYAFYGHSMGALIAFEIARRQWDHLRISPVQLMVAARRAPHLRARDETLHERPTEKVIDFLKGLGVASRQVLDNVEIMELLLPALRADLKLDASYRFVPGSGVPCPITVFTGSKDEYVTADEAAQWSHHAGHGFQSKVIPGDHFFMDHPEPRRALWSEIKRVVADSI